MTKYRSIDKEIGALRIDSDSSDSDYSGIHTPKKIYSHTHILSIYLSL